MQGFYEELHIHLCFKLKGQIFINSIMPHLREIIGLYGCELNLGTIISYG